MAAVPHARHLLRYLPRIQPLLVLDVVPTVGSALQLAAVDVHLGKCEEILKGRHLASEIFVAEHPLTQC